MSEIGSVSGSGMRHRPPPGSVPVAQGFSDSLKAAETKAVAAGGEVIKGFSPSHPGVDIARELGSSVEAFAPGTVESAGWAGDRGNLLVVREGTSRSYYGHLESFLAAPGDQVKAGQALGRSGATGATLQPSLHFEVHQGGKPVDPSSLLADL